MPACHDMQCAVCGEIVYDLPITIENTRCACGKGRMEIYWGATRSRNAIALGRDETTVVYEHPVTGKVLYPGQNNRPMPERYREQGYQRRELRSLREVDSFSAKHGLVNERAHYDKGSGRGYDQ